MEAGRETLAGVELLGKLVVVGGRLCVVEKVSGMLRVRGRHCGEENEAVRSCERPDVAMGMR